MPCPNDSDPETNESRGARGLLDPRALDALEELAQGTTADLLGELIDAFHEHGALSLQRIRTSAASSDLDAVGKAAHELRGTAVTFGADTLVALCDQVEEQAQRGTPGDLKVLVPRLEEEIERVHQALQEEIASRQGKAHTE